MIKNYHNCEYKTFLMKVEVKIAVYSMMGKYQSDPVKVNLKLKVIGSDEIIPESIFKVNRSFFDLTEGRPVFMDSFSHP